MEIRTKFNIGDKIWFIDRYTEKNEYIWRVITCWGKWEILGFKVFGDGVYCVLFEEGYRNKQHFESREIYKEKNCFATKEQAQKECERRNGKN